MYPALRIMIGLLFFAVGASKLLGHYQNFLYVIQSYEVFPAAIEDLVARVFPWIEFFLGLFLILGLWLRWTLAGTALMLAGFLLVVGQAIIRGLPIDSCGCFGEWLTVPLPVIFGFDLMALSLTVMMRIKLVKTSRFSLDSILRDS